MAITRTNAIIGKAVVTIDGTDVGLIAEGGVTHVLTEERVGLTGDNALDDVAEHRFKQSHSFELMLKEVPLTILKKLFGFTDAVAGSSLDAKPSSTVTEHTVVILGGGPSGKSRRITCNTATLLITDPGAYAENAYQSVGVRVKCLLDPSSGKSFTYEDVTASSTAPTIADYQEVESDGTETDITDTDTDFVVSSDVQVTFSKEIAPGSVSALYFSLITDANGTEISGTVGYGDATAATSGTQDRTKVVFVPASDLDASTTYHLIVKAGVEALDGTTLAAGGNLTFTTAS